MNARAVRLLERLFAAGLRLYPPALRRAYAAEMQSVFALRIQAAARRGPLALLAAALRELRDLPLAAAAARWRAFGGTMPRVYPATSDQTPWAAALLSLLPFVLAGPARTALMYAANYAIPGRQNALAVYFLPLLALCAALLAVGLAVGAARRFPRWAYPYPLALVFALIDLNLTGAYAYGWQLPRGMSYLLLCGVLLLLYLPGLRSFYHNIRPDWTLLSYCLFGLVFFPLNAVDRDELPFLSLQSVLPGLIWLAAALAHLRIRQARARIMALAAAGLVGPLVALLPVLNGIGSTALGLLVWFGLLLLYSGVLVLLLLSPLLVARAMARAQPGAGPGEPPDHTP